MLTVLSILQIVIMIPVITFIFLENGKRAREEWLLWAISIGSFLVIILISWHATIEGIELGDLFSVFIWTGLFTISLRRALRQHYMEPSLYGAVPSKKKARENFDKGAVSAWRTLVDPEKGDS